MTNTQIHLQRFLVKLRKWPESLALHIFRVTWLSVRRGRNFGLCQRFLLYYEVDLCVTVSSSVPRSCAASVLSQPTILRHVVYQVFDSEFLMSLPECLHFLKSQLFYIILLASLVYICHYLSHTSDLFRLCSVMLGKCKIMESSGDGNNCLCKYEPL